MSHEVEGFMAVGFFDDVFPTEQVVKSAVGMIEDVSIPGVSVRLSCKLNANRVRWVYLVHWPSEIRFCPSEFHRLKVHWVCWAAPAAALGVRAGLRHSGALRDVCNEDKGKG